MATRYLHFANREDAAVYSRKAWLKVRPNPSPDDVTQLLYSFEEGEDGTAVLAVPTLDSDKLDDGDDTLLLLAPPPSFKVRTDSEEVSKADYQNQDGSIKAKSARPLANPKTQIKDE